MKNYIHEGSRELWFNALRDPNEKIQYITVLTFPPDSVYKQLQNNQGFKQHYQKVYNYEKFEIYKRNP